MVWRAVGDIQLHGFPFGRADGEIEGRYRFANGLVGHAQRGGVGMNIYAGKLGRSIAGRKAAGDQVGRVYVVVAERLVVR